MSLPLLALGAAEAVPKLIASYTQGKRARDLRLQDTTPAAFSEKLQLDRQAAGTARLPGLNAQYSRLGAVQAGALQSARLGAASGSDFLAAAGAADARRASGEQQLGTLGLQYQDKSRQQLGASLQQQAAYQQRDLDNYNREKAALTQSSAENAANAVSGLASYGAAAINRQDGLDEAAANRAAGLTPYGTPIGALPAPAAPAAPKTLTGLYPTNTPKARRLPGLSASDGTAYDLGALPSAAPTPGIATAPKPRRPGIGLPNRLPRIGLGY